MTKFSRIIPKLFLHQPLGEVLCHAGLITEAQIEVVLHDQPEHQELKFGEILALRGWLKQKTSDFFADQWQSSIQEQPKELLGRYLKRAGLLDAEQIETILEEQQHTGYKFGAIAILHGWMTPKTLDFFLDSLFPGVRTEQPFIRKQRELGEAVEPEPLFIGGNPVQQTGQDAPVKDATIPWID